MMRDAISLDVDAQRKSGAFARRAITTAKPMEYLL
jgi:hypothetical protein